MSKKRPQRFLPPLKPPAPLVVAPKPTKTRPWELPGTLVTSDILTNELVIETARDMGDFIEKCSWTSGAPIPLFFSVSKMPKEELVRVQVVGQVKERDSGDVFQVSAAEFIYLPTSTREAFNRAYKLCLRLMEHEVQETLTVCGRRVLDPHKGKR